MKKSKYKSLAGKVIILKKDIGQYSLKAGDKGFIKYFNPSYRMRRKPFIVTIHNEAIALNKRDFEVMP